MIVLGIETSCDETCSAVLEYDKNQQCNILSNIIYSQISEHKDYGGVVPEIAARSHINNIDVVVQKSVKDARNKLQFSERDCCYIRTRTQRWIIGWGHVCKNNGKYPRKTTYWDKSP